MFLYLNSFNKHFRSKNKHFIVAKKTRRGSFRWLGLLCITSFTVLYIKLNKPVFDKKKHEISQSELLSPEEKTKYLRALNANANSGLLRLSYDLSYTKTTQTFKKN